MHGFVRYRLFDRIFSYFPPRRPGAPCRDSTSRLSAFTRQAAFRDVERFELSFVTSPSPLSVGLFFPSDRDGHRIGVGLGAPDDAATPDHAEACVRAAAPAYRTAPQDRLASRVSAPDHR